MEHLIVFSADLHGNEMQYQKLIDFADSNSAGSVIIGGDITPGWVDKRHLIYSQRSFLLSRLPLLLSPLNKRLPECQIFLIMGNDDCACNMDVLERQGGKVFHVVHGRRLELTEDFDIVGYSFVPITPFGLKDWEKFDLSEVPQDLAAEYTNRKVENCCFDGFKSTINGWEEFRFTEGMEKEDSIQKDLKKRVFTKNPEKTVYVTHTPPNRTNLDQSSYENHLGSMAVRRFIEKHQPYSTLHGHIHETVDVSGQFKENIGNSLSLSAGNKCFEEKLSIVTFDLYDLKTARRLVM